MCESVSSKSPKTNYKILDDSAFFTSKAMTHSLRSHNRKLKFTEIFFYHQLYTERFQFKLQLTSRYMVSTKLGFVLRKNDVMVIVFRMHLINQFHMNTGLRTIKSFSLCILSLKPGCIWPTDWWFRSNFSFCKLEKRVNLWTFERFWDTLPLWRSFNLSN